ncbi:hypothetical protein [Cohnella terricola]|uniref:Uncharacterized protein n=1 Tax=Cohnella terricola TaxID=1289167 RepID=A0A559JB96_9BACL|nr:hypothetical protein [Cohnella terricola]TVX97156.1 hypothetical protein FPZ45_19615 [Cohnella terricola]
MFSIYNGIIGASALLLLILSWIGGRKASRLLYGGSAARLHRKTRKQMVWAAYIALPSIGIIAATLHMTASMPSVFWEDRVLLHLPLTLVPILAIWLLAMPRLWALWKTTRTDSGAPLPVEVRRQAAHPMLVVPFQTSAIAAAAILYFLLVTPVSLRFGNAIVPILLWATASAALWTIRDRRCRAIARPADRYESGFVADQRL